LISKSQNHRFAVTPFTRSYTTATMSVTTTANPRTYEVQAVLADYDLHHSGAADDGDAVQNTNQPSQQSNPSDWPTDYRRVPPYRPVNMELDQDERRVYNAFIERAFVAILFTGVVAQSVSIIYTREEGRAWDFWIDC
jgi:hypothetical protein